MPDVQPKQLRKAVLELLDAYEKLPSFDVEQIEQASRAFCDDKGWKSRKVFMLLRYIVTGRKASPPLFETMVVIGKELTRRRMRVAAEFIGRQRA